MLALLLRLCGLIDCLALIVALMPTPWIAAFHSHLGIGTFPTDTITHYLAHSSSLMYVVHGLILLYLSFHINRYLPLIRLLALISFILATQGQTSCGCFGKIEVNPWLHLRS